MGKIVGNGLLLVNGVQIYSTSGKYRQRIGGTSEHSPTFASAWDLVVAEWNNQSWSEWSDWAGWGPILPRGWACGWGARYPQDGKYVAHIYTTELKALFDLSGITTPEWAYLIVKFDKYDLSSNVDLKTWGPGAIRCTELDTGIQVRESQFCIIGDVKEYFGSSDVVFSFTQIDNFASLENLTPPEPSELGMQTTRGYLRNRTLGVQIRYKP